MKRGGARKGAGRKPGAVTKRTREVANGALATGVTPLEYMLKIMRDPLAEPERRDDMAKASAPYIHAKLAAVEHSGPGGGDIPMRHSGELKLSPLDLHLEMLNQK